MTIEVIFTTYFLNTLFGSTLFKTKSSGSSGRNTYQSDTYQSEKMQEKTFSSPLSSHYGQTLEETDQTKACIVVNFILTYLISFFILTQLFFLDTNFPDAKKKWQQMIIKILTNILNYNLVKSIADFCIDHLLCFGQGMIKVFSVWATTYFFLVQENLVHI